VALLLLLQALRQHVKSAAMMMKVTFFTCVILVDYDLSLQRYAIILT